MRMKLRADCLHSIHLRLRSGPGDSYWVIWDNRISPPKPLANHLSHTTAPSSSSTQMIATFTETLKHQNANDLPEFARLALRAHHRAARKLRAEHRRLGLPIIVWENGRVVEKQP